MYVRTSYVHNGGRDQLSSEWCHNQNDVIMRIAGLWRYGEWQHVATYWLQVQSPNHRITTHVCHFNTSKPSVWLPVVHKAIQWHIHKIKKWSHIFPWCVFVYVCHLLHLIKVLNVRLKFGNFCLFFVETLLQCSAPLSLYLQIRFKCQPLHTDNTMANINGQNTQ